MNATVTKTKTNGAVTPCLCGCGLATKANYLPGHDARHVGQVARQAFADGMIETTGAYAALPSAALRAKARRMAENLADKADAKASKPAKKATAPKVPTQKAKTTTTKNVKADEPVLGAVKKGRWEYPAIKTADGQVLRKETRDGSGPWVPTDLEFRPGS